MSKIEKLVFDLAAPNAEQIGCEVIEVEYKKEGSDYFLRVYIDKETESVGINDCEYVSRALESEIDKLDPIKEAYFLEVCSPGIDRALKRDKDFVRFIESEVDVKLFAPRDNKKEFCGVLKAYDGTNVTIELEDKSELVFDKNDAAYIKLAVRF